MEKADEWTRMHAEHEDGAVFGETQFADLTSDEFVEQVLLKSYTPQAHLARDVSDSLLPIAGEDDNDLLLSTTANMTADAAPTSWDWNAQGKVTPVRDQLSCGACWAFASLAEVESLIMIKTQGKLQLVLVRLCLAVLRDSWL